MEESGEGDKCHKEASESRAEALEGAVNQPHQSALLCKELNRSRKCLQEQMPSEQDKAMAGVQKPRADPDSQLRPLLEPDQRRCSVCKGNSSRLADTSHLITHLTFPVFQEAQTQSR